MLGFPGVCAIGLAAAASALGQVQDAQPMTRPDKAHFGGLLGSRLTACAEAAWGRGPSVRLLRRGASTHTL